MSRVHDLERIEPALRRAGDVLVEFSRRRVHVSYKDQGSPVTDADFAVDEMLRRELPREGEGWLSEESDDDPARLERRRVWIVDPLDGTREFLAGIPEWCVSIGLVEDGQAVAGGIYAPLLDELYLGSLDTGAALNGDPIAASSRTTLAGGVVAVNRWAMQRPRGQRLRGRGFEVREVGPLAYTLALVAAGRVDATWGRSPKPEWDIAAGAALISAAGGHVTDWNGRPLVFNRWPPRAPGIVACGSALTRAVRALVRAEDAPAARRR
jgi:myo-inositol-1(or 4)-monophosphatase